MRHSSTNYRHAFAAFATSATLLFSGGSQAQVFRCGSSFQNTPCDNRSTRLVQAGGGAQTYPSPVRSLPGVEAPPSYYDHLSGHCKELNDAIRTSRLRGIGSDALRGVHRQWEQECSLDASIAMREQQQDAAQAQREQLAARQAAQEEKLKPQRERARCEEMALALSSKEHKPNRSEGEQADLDRFKENYNARCVRH